MIKLRYWIKFYNEPPRLYQYDHLDAMWFDLREKMLKEPQRFGIIEWMIRD